MNAVVSLPTLGIIGSVAAASFVWQMRLRHKEDYWILDFVLVGIMLGFITVGLLTWVTLPNFSDVVYLVWGYAPHAYNLVVWPVLALLILRPRFGPIAFLPAFVLVYGLDELAWNSIAFLHFGENAGILGFTTAYWHAFLAAIVIGVVVSYLTLRPRIVPNWTWGFFAVYVFVYAVLAGLPTYVDESLSNSWYVYLWELMWQGAVWIFIYGTFWKRDYVKANG